MIAGLLLAVGCALAGSLALLLKQRGAVMAPVVLARHPIRSAIGLFGSKWWTVGWLVALCAWLLHVGALSLASLSIVQAVSSGGLVFLAILAERFFGFELGRRQWIGLVVTAVGLAILGVNQAPAARQHASAAALIVVEGAVIALSAGLICASIRLERLQLRAGTHRGRQPPPDPRRSVGDPAAGGHLKRARVSKMRSSAHAQPNPERHRSVVRLQASWLCKAWKGSSFDSAADPCGQHFRPDRESFRSAIALRRELEANDPHPPEQPLNRPSGPLASVLSRETHKRVGRC